MAKAASKKTPPLDPATPGAYAASNALRALFCDVGLTTQPFFGNNPLYLRVLTRAGWANVHAEPCGDHVTLFVQFDTPCLATHLGIDSNVNSGKWNHHWLSTDRKLVSEQVDRLFEPLVPRGEHAVAEAQFFGAVADLIEQDWHEAMSRWFGLSDEERERVNRRRIPVLRECGVPSTDPHKHVGCASCGTDYSGQAAHRFWTTAGRFLAGG